MPVAVKSTVVKSYSTLSLKLVYENADEGVALINNPHSKSLLDIFKTSVPAGIMTAYGLPDLILIVAIL